jgi:hypothetical protein
VKKITSSFQLLRTGTVEKIEGTKEGKVDTVLWSFPTMRARKVVAILLFCEHYVTTAATKHFICT